MYIFPFYPRTKLQKTQPVRYCRTYFNFVIHKCDALCDLVPFMQFKKREKHSWRSVNSSKVAGFKPATLLELTLLHRYFSRFLDFTNGTKSRNAPQIKSQR